MLLDDTQDVVEVLCEHHEDILLKHRDGSLSGHQVKSRGDDQPTWKAGDEAVLSACARFAKLDSEFPGRFRAFRFLTNHPLHSAKNGQDLAYVLRQVRAASTVTDLPGGIARWIKRVARAASVEQSVAFAAMVKTTVYSDLPKLQDTLARLVGTLAQSWEDAANCPHQSVQQAAHGLINECCRASSLAHAEVLPAYCRAATDPVAVEVKARIDGKRMTRDRVQAVLRDGRDSKAPLVGDPALSGPPGAGSTDLMYKKLDAGGFSAISRASAEELRNKADYLAIKWTKQYGNARGLARYDHIRTIVLTDAGRAFDAKKNAEQHFGPPMREEFRLLIQRRRDDHEQLYDCANEHLEGFAFSLTAQCKIQWSLDKPWELE